ncbi:MAG: hypothetical protein LBE04_06450 [Prevotellaceae bacterium]|jgi:hypothetical protein|nr:hypothetical protein [Prevotellaceae bacterium]
MVWILIILIFVLVFLLGWWAVPLIIIIFIILICLAASQESKTKSENQPDSHSINTSQGYDAPSVIDITPAKSPNESPIVEVPYWAHQYVYSYSEINRATHKQQRFYFHFKNRFLNGEYIDLNENTNYAFILLFDLLNGYDRQQTNIAELENHLKLLGQHYPKTKSYANSFLIKRMENAGNNEGAERIREEEYGYWKLGVIYRNKLNLTSNQVKLLNHISYSSNNFNTIDFCMKEIVKLYLSLVGELQNKYIQEGTTLDAELESIASLIAKQKYNYPKNLDTKNKYLVDGVIYEIHSNIFKYCENAVREFYGHKRKINIDPDYRAKTKELYETKIYSKITESLPDLVLKITPPDEETEIELNSQNTTRWKMQFKILTENYTGNPKEFVAAVIALGKLNKNNPSVELVFFEASKFIAKYDRISALSLYMHYLFYDLQSSTFDNRQLTKTIQKSLFKNNEQLRDFEIIVSEFLQSKDLKKALQNVSGIYAPKRKKIQLNTDSVRKVRQQHSGTVELLNEYLQDEYEDENNTINTREINNDEIEMEIIQKTTLNDPPRISPYIPAIPFVPVHISILTLFAKNNLSVSQNEIEIFAKSKGLFKNQIIESINEACYEQLDDNLIEDDDEYYIINPDYYQTILAK